MRVGEETLHKFLKKILTLIVLSGALNAAAWAFDDYYGYNSPINLISPSPIATTNPANIYHDMYYGDNKSADLPVYHKKISKVDRNDELFILLTVSSLGIAAIAFIIEIQLRSK